jgi:hypothetical protein
MREKESSPNSAPRPFPQPKLYQPAYGNVLATIVDHFRQAGNEPRREIHTL